MDKIHRSFIHENLMPRILSAEAPKAINLQSDFRDHNINQREGSARSERIAIDQIDQLCKDLNQHLLYWRAQGIPQPLTHSDQENILLTWRHPEFQRYSGFSSKIDANFCEIFKYIQSLDGDSFPVVCALWLKCIGIREMYICDSKGDKGVDILGIFEEGGLRSLAIVIQAKTSKAPIGHGIVLGEYGKYLMLPHTEKYIQYRKTLKIDDRVEGSSWVYMFLANQSFEPHARRISSKLGILLRSIHQLTFLLAKNYKKDQIDSEVRRLSPVKADLESNFYSKLSI